MFLRVAPISFLSLSHHSALYYWQKNYEQRSVSVPLLAAGALLGALAEGSKEESISPPIIHPPFSWICILTAPASLVSTLFFQPGIHLELPRSFPQTILIVATWGSAPKLPFPPSDELHPILSFSFPLSSYLERPTLFLPLFFCGSGPKFIRLEHPSP